MMVVDATDAFRAAAQLAAVAAATNAATSAVVKKGALNVKNDAAATVRDRAGGGRLRHYPHSISYDVTVTASRATAEIGPDKDRMQGALGNIIEFGTATLPPVVPHLGPALDRESDTFEDHVGDAAVKLAEALL